MIVKVCLKYSLFYYKTSHCVLLSAAKDGITANVKPLSKLLALKKYGSWVSAADNFTVVCHSRDAV